MADDALEIAILEAFLRDTDFTYLEDLTFPTIPEGGLGRSEAEHMLRWHGLYKAIRAEFPNFPFHDRTLSAIWDENYVEETAFYRGPLMGGHEYPSSRWHGGPAEAIAAAFLGQQGHVDVVLVAGVMLCHGYRFCTGDGRALVDGYRNLLPAIASFTSATSGTSFASLDIPPGWYDSGHYGPNPIMPNALTRVLNPKPSDDERRSWVATDPPTIRLDRPNEEAWVVDVGLVGAMLNVDLPFLTSDDLHKVEAETESFIEYLVDPEFDPEELPVHVDTYFTAYLVTSHTERLMDDALNCSLPYPESLNALSAKHPWIAEWARESWRFPHCWPTGPFRDALMSSETAGSSGWFIFDRESPLT